MDSQTEEQLFLKGFQIAVKRGYAYFTPDGEPILRANGEFLMREAGMRAGILIDGQNPSAEDVYRATVVWFRELIARGR